MIEPLIKYQNRYNMKIITLSHILQSVSLGSQTGVHLIALSFSTHLNIVRIDARFMLICFVWIKKLRFSTWITGYALPILDISTEPAHDMQEEKKLYRGHELTIHSHDLLTHQHVLLIRFLVLSKSCA